MTKTRESSVVSTRKIVSGEHLNPNGTLFGGYLMCWMDEVAFMCARRFTGHPTCVTVNIDNVTFRNAIRSGEQIVLTATVNYVGYTSMEIEVSVEREDSVTHELTHTNSAHLTFVCLDNNFKPMRVPELLLQTEDDFQKGHEAKLRIRVRRRLINFLSKQKIDPRALHLAPPSGWDRRRAAWVGRFNRLVARFGFGIELSGQGVR